MELLAAVIVVCLDSFKTNLQVSYLRKTISLERPVDHQVDHLGTNSNSRPTLILSLLSNGPYGDVGRD